MRNPMAARRHPVGVANFHAISPGGVVFTGVAAITTNASSLFSFPRFSTCPERLAVPERRGNKLAQNKKRDYGSQFRSYYRCAQRGKIGIRPHMF